MTEDVVPRQTAPTDSVQRLKRNAVGTFGVIFMAVATAAPITAMVGNVPIAVGFGNGSHAPAGYLVATVVLGLFAIGYATMAKHITATGAFYGYISHGLGRVMGMASGGIITMAYVVFEASLIGIFAFFFQNFLSSQFGFDIHWLIPALLMLALNCILTYFDVNLTAKVLGVFLVTEIVMLSLGAIAVAVKGGGPDGFAVGEILNPVGAFQPAAIAGASAGLGLFFAFWSWVGFESTAMYGEESKDPKRIIPRATMIAVLGVGLFYVFVSWMAIAGTGPKQAVELAQSADTSSEIFFAPVRTTYGEWAITLFNILLVSGSFACGMAFHNCASRYLYALGREGLSTRLQDTLGATHKTHGSPHIASFVQTGITLVLILAFFAAGMDPYIHMYTLLAILGTMAILIVQSLCAFSVIAYFHFHKNHPSSAHWFKTFLAPLLGGIGMLYVVYLLWEHKESAAGAASGTLLFKLTPWIVVGLFALGAAMALYFKFNDKRRYELIGRIVYDDSEIRD
ncbi:MULTISPECIES: APC family permease [Mycolicibacterium]|uniref:Amino acid/polyamine/organocation transporter, APC superfamily n=2 Tax=Mycolicibacterium TaxID=1866885 RepID=A1TGM9_MYCVP|nr:MULTISPECIES: APC family permease [Mycolicibacterium]ABM16329.1 amino acid/polyamine/organocation transporter, APC superfamily [Mycolicibacterium vanbaalenii PYR-1]MCV7127646.1 APC family permease [Mycolicibacterium vanbaalenii PYR-1]MDN4519474.1 APC family permease [Mycolicibacterium austroafricanum]PQP47650.1 APC family permease [Mycolicibacterium austroafricanum]QRZ06620.1 APC family permease [Mycolicibacterium austroafricanum]